MKDYFRKHGIRVLLIVVAAVFGSFGYSYLTTRTHRITLPAVRPDGSYAPAGPSDTSARHLEVTPDTVQAVIASLDRADSYYRQLTISTFWSGGSSETAVQTWVDGEYTYVRTVLPSGQIRHTLSQGDTVYYWYSGSSTWFTAPAGTLSPDLSQRIPTSEDVLALDADLISRAGFESYGDLPCVFVETRVDDPGYLERYWIGTDSGLLVGAQTVKDGVVVYEMNAAAPIQTPCPTDVVFALPNGQSLHSF